MELNELEVASEEPPGTGRSIYKQWNALGTTLLPFGISLRPRLLFNRRNYHSYLFCIGQREHATLVKSL